MVHKILTHMFSVYIDKISVGDIYLIYVESKHSIFGQWLNSYQFCMNSNVS